MPSPRVVADLHIHSRFSRATSKALSPRVLAGWARVKGVDLLATGDATHPGWLEELRELLVPDGTGFFTLKDPAGLEREVPLAAALRGREAAFPGEKTRFVLSAEISSIYKQGGKVRKVHNLLYMPSLEAFERLNLRLARIGNLASDGRPILGLDSRRLLDLVLSTEPRGFVIPAHVWTPWFSLLGAKSGFDSVDECFGDLSSEIFALETGLSSDPPMNRLVSGLDRFALVSNSDAHSGEKLGREANLFEGLASFDGLREALRARGGLAPDGSRFLGTVEFFPEEGKYHLDGHRSCEVVLTPGETRAHGGRCPVCGKPVTTGVLNRVMELADRAAPVAPEHESFASLIPLSELIEDATGARPGTKKSGEILGRLTRSLGPELSILMDADVAEIGRHGWALGEAVARMRAGKVIRTSGYDGEYGRIGVFDEAEKAELRGGRRLTPVPVKVAPAPRPETPTAPRVEAAPVEQAPPAVHVLNARQQAAVQAGPGPVLALAGPGTGKTRTLMARIERLLADGVAPRDVLAVTFTRKAAGELRERLAKQGADSGKTVRADTLHALAFERWTKTHGEPPALLTEDAADRLFRLANPDLPKGQARTARLAYDLARERRESLAEAMGKRAAAARAYQREKRKRGLTDFIDLLEDWLDGLERGPEIVGRWRHLLVDEVQDLTRLQLDLLCRMAWLGGGGFFAIGDPDQAIYGFRGAETDAAARLKAVWTDLRIVGLAESYRCPREILDLAGALLESAPLRAFSGQARAVVGIRQATTAVREAAWIAQTIHDLLGGASLTLVGATQARTEKRMAVTPVSPSDIAVLVRTRTLIEPLRRALATAGVPCVAPEADGWRHTPVVAAFLDEAARRLAGVTDPVGLNGLTGIAGEASAGETALAAALREVDDAAWARGPAVIAARLKAGGLEAGEMDSAAFRALVQAFREKDAKVGWAGLIAQVRLADELDEVAANAEGVRVMTLHAAKGLEFEAVFLPALEDGLMPFMGMEFLTGKGAVRSSEAGLSWQEMEAEERRLLYVGLTRARRALYLSWAGKRDVYGRTLSLKPSRFLARLPKSLFTATGGERARKVTAVKQLTLM